MVSILKCLINACKGRIFEDAFRQILILIENFELEQVRQWNSIPFTVQKPQRFIFEKNYQLRFGLR